MYTFQYFCYSGRDKFVDTLIEMGANVNAATTWGITPLYIAAYYGNLFST